jgi:hypothetical protein
MRRLHRQVIERKAGKKWLPQVDDLRTFLTDFVANVPQVVPTLGTSRQSD